MLNDLLNDRHRDSKERHRQSQAHTEMGCEEAAEHKGEEEAAQHVVADHIQEEPAQHLPQHKGPYGEEEAAQHLPQHKRQEEHLAQHNRPTSSFSLDLFASSSPRECDGKSTVSSDGKSTVSMSSVSICEMSVSMCHMGR
jgi:hypothetical protein